MCHLRDLHGKVVRNTQLDVVSVPAKSGRLSRIDGTLTESYCVVRGAFRGAGDGTIWPSREAEKKLI